MDSETDGEEERSEFNTSEIDWGEEQDSSWSEEEDNNNLCGGSTKSELSTGESYERDKEADYEAPPWPGDEYPSYNTGSESDFEPELPDYSQISREEEDCREKELNNYGEFDEFEETTYQTDELRDYNEEENYEETGSECEEDERPWCEIPYFNHEEETESERSQEEFDEEEEVKSEAGRDDFCEAYTKEDEDLLEEPRYIHFAGHEQGPEAYLRWEEDMEYWMRSQNIPKEKKLSHALDTLVGEAQAWWINEEVHTSYHNPVINWGHLKQRMYKEFVQKSHNKSYIPKRLIFKKNKHGGLQQGHSQPRGKEYVPTYSKEEA